MQVVGVGVVEDGPVGFGQGIDGQDGGRRAGLAGAVGDGLGEGGGVAQPEW